jgi:hypothetical protein
MTPPQVVTPGSPITLTFEFTNFESGTPTDPSQLQLDITYGGPVGNASDYAGPFQYAGASMPLDATIWRTGTGQYSFLWNVPLTALPGAYVANWTSTYGAGDVSLAVENFVVAAGGPFIPVPSGDIGYWTGAVTYSPNWSNTPLSIEFGATDPNGITWLWQQITGWDSPPSVGQVVQRSADHGGWAAPQYYGPRLLTLTVMASAPTQGLRDQARAQLQQVFPVNDLAVLRYDEPVPKIAYVRPSPSPARRWPMWCSPCRWSARTRGSTRRRRRRSRWSSRRRSSTRWRCPTRCRFRSRATSHPRTPQ